MLFYCDHWHDSVKMTMAFTTRYGELIPGADWGVHPLSFPFQQLRWNCISSIALVS